MRFRTVRQAVLHSTVYEAGAEFSHLPVAWPSRLDLEPLDDEARLVMNYAAKHAANPWRPRTLRDRAGGIYLPAVFRDVYAPPDMIGGAFRKPPLIEVVDARPGMPLYKLGDASVVSLAWPIDSFSLKPVNDEAHRVAAYLMAAFESSRTSGVPPDRAGRNIDGLILATPSPWCEFRNALHLPNEDEVLASKPLAVIAA